MTVEYNFDIYDTANDKVVPGVLSTEIEASSITVGLSHVNTDGDDINIYFSSALSSPEETTLSGIVANHDGEPIEERHDPARHAHDFTVLFDTPNSYTGAAPRSVKVKEDETGLNFIDEDLQMSWQRNPLYNNHVKIVGHYFDVADEVNLSSEQHIEPSEKTDNSFFALNMIEVSGTPFTLTIEGAVADDFSGSYSNQIEHITITGTGYYRTTRRFTNAPSFYIEENGKACVFDLKRFSFCSFNESKVMITRLRFEWVPDGTNWDIATNIYHLYSDGHVELIDEFAFNYIDAYKRAGIEEPGVFNASGYNYIIDGSNEEGFLVSVTQSFIGELSLILWYREIK